MKQRIKGLTYYIEKETRKIADKEPDFVNWRQGYGVYRVSRAPGHPKEVIGFVYRGGTQLKGGKSMWVLWGFNRQWETRDEAVRFATDHPHITAPLAVRPW
jgi:hypothetical protein